MSFFRISNKGKGKAVPPPANLEWDGHHTWQTYEDLPNFTTLLLSYEPMLAVMTTSRLQFCQCNNQPKKQRGNRRNQISSQTIHEENHARRITPSFLQLL